MGGLTGLQGAPQGGRRGGPQREAPGARPRRHARTTGALLALCAAFACAGPQAAVHVVQPGENVYRIASYYRVPVTEILDENRIRDVHALEPGTVLLIPGAERPPPDEPLRPPDALRDPMHSPLTEPAEPWVSPRSDAERRAEALAAAAASGHRFVWPVEGRVSSRYGRRSRRLHHGIDIAAPKGTPIRAAEAGRVVFSGRNGSYGQVVVIDHDGPFRTLYAHNRRNRVEAGERVERGEVVAEVGESGNATGPHVHFEIRYRRGPTDPLLFLPILTDR